MTAYDPALSARLALSARAHKEWDAESANSACSALADSSDYVDGWNTALGEVAVPLADQLDAAGREVARLRAIAGSTLILAKQVTRSDIYERLRADVYRGADYAEQTAAIPFSTELEASQREIARLRAVLERPPTLYSPSVTEVVELRCVVCDAVHPCVDEALVAGWVYFEGQWRCGLDRCLATERDALRAQVEQMRSVVEASEQYVDAGGAREETDVACDLQAAVSAYRATRPSDVCRSCGITTMPGPMLVPEGADREDT
jgi:hypothetical protein